MMSQRLLVEILHVVAGVMGTLFIASMASWAVPSAHETIWIVAWVSAVVVAAMGIPALKAARAADRSSAGGVGRTIADA